jgi:hypothetical protein
MVSNGFEKRKVLFRDTLQLFNRGVDYRYRKTPKLFQQVSIVEDEINLFSSYH